MRRILKPPGPVYWRYVGYGSPVTVGIITPIAAGQEWYGEFVSSRSLWVTYVNRTTRDRILYVGSEAPGALCTAPPEQRGLIDAPSQELFLSQATKTFSSKCWRLPTLDLCKDLESVICELFRPPSNKVTQIMPLAAIGSSETGGAASFWNRNYA